MVTDDLLKQVAFIKEIDKLKYIQRRTKLFGSDRHENDAEHSWHLAMMTLVLAQHADRPVDVLRVLKMVLIHDLVEIDAGDTFIYDTVRNHTNTDEERLAAQRIFGLLPEAQADEFLAIWEEFEEGLTDDAKFARTMDRFEPLLQNVSNNGGTWAEFQYKLPYRLQQEKSDQTRLCCSLELCRSAARRKCRKGHPQERHSSGSRTAVKSSSWPVSNLFRYESSIHPQPFCRLFSMRALIAVFS